MERFRLTTHQTASLTGQLETLLIYIIL